MRVSAPVVIMFELFDLPFYLAMLYPAELYVPVEPGSEFKLMSVSTVGSIVAACFKVEDSE